MSKNSTQEKARRALPAYLGDNLAPTPDIPRREGESERDYERRLAAAIDLEFLELDQQAWQALTRWLRRR